MEQTGDETGSTLRAALARAVPRRYLLDRNLVFVGSPDTVPKKVKAAASEGLFNTLFGDFNFRALSEDDLMRSITLFGTTVLPHLREYQPN